ncbi:MAG: hypothetical protein BJ554DRAFT_518 [Olpidium bornovanus]|uniref:Uncharacterized protein n=1 Tax=Olpidium bornovanus TaxID=278681 RepID=A0A8H7ZU94_9FUNG|nr:MAG: hypothetical protein BJ554DRAFT_518 [Olpidium bornovanus]
MALPRDCAGAAFTPAECEFVAGDQRVHITPTHRLPELHFIAVRFSFRRSAGPPCSPLPAPAGTPAAVRCGKTALSFRLGASRKKRFRRRLGEGRCLPEATVKRAGGGGAAAAARRSSAWRTWRRRQTERADRAFAVPGIVRAVSAAHPRGSPAVARRGPEEGAKVRCAAARVAGRRWVADSPSFFCFAPSAAAGFAPSARESLLVRPGNLTRPTRRFSEIRAKATWNRNCSKRTRRMPSASCLSTFWRPPSCCLRCE